jgi:hypothetical protein
LDYAHKVRSKRLREYTILLVVFGVIPLILGAAVLLTEGFGWLNRPGNGQPYDPLFAWILAAFWIPAGAAICVWGEFALRMQAGFSYEQLLNLDPSRWRPGQRLLITVGISFIFAFLLAYDAIQVGLGSLLLNDFAKKTPAMALEVGGITGLALIWSVAVIGIGAWIWGDRKAAANSVTTTGPQSPVVQDTKGDGCLGIDVRFHTSCVARRYGSIPRPEQNDPRKIPQKRRFLPIKWRPLVLDMRLRRHRLAIACQNIVRRDHLI